MGIISKLKEKFLGKQDHVELEQALTLEKEQRAAEDFRIVTDRFNIVPEPPYRRSTTASRRAAQRKLDESRNKRPTYANRKMLRQVAAGHAPF